MSATKANIPEAGGLHYGIGCTPWDLQRSMQSWGSLFVDARRTDVIEYLFRKKGDKQKQLDDAKKALHNCQVIIEELEKELSNDLLHIKDNTCKPSYVPEAPRQNSFHNSHNWNGVNRCLNCGKMAEQLSLPCTNPNND